MKTIIKGYYAFPLLDIDRLEVEKLLQIFAIWNPMRYKYGGKAKGDSINERAANPKPIDCSGFFGMALDRITERTETPTLRFHSMGSREQYEAIKKAGFKVSTDPGAKDGILRSYHLLSEDSSNGIGHIGFILDGYTIESSSRKGVWRREWNGKRYPFLLSCHSFVLAVPENGTGGAL